MRKISADWIFPASSAPAKNGVVIVDEAGKILDVSERKYFEPSDLEIYSGIICPGFINAHCHAELSYMKGKIPGKKEMIQFIMDVIDFRNGFTVSLEEENREIIYDAIRKAEAEMIENGIVAVGDISNDNYTFDFKSQSKLKYHTFVECFGFYPEKAENYFDHSRKVFEEARKKNLNASITPHAPYSVPPELLKLIFSFEENHPSIFSYHNQESEAENEFFRSGTGNFVKLFEHFKLPLSIFHRTGKNSLESVLPFFPKDKKMLLVHNAVSTGNDFKMADAGYSSLTTHHSLLYFCTCPNANLYIEGRLPDYSHWKNYPNQICLGTDSYASNHQLSILEEMITIWKHAPEVSLDQLIQWGTLNGAKFFDWDQHLGSIEKGKTPGLNLITSIRESPFQLTESSKIQRLV